MLSRFHMVPERNARTDRRTDGRTDRFAISISRVSMLTRDKNYTLSKYMTIFSCIFNFNILDLIVYETIGVPNLH